MMRLKRKAASIKHKKLLQEKQARVKKRALQVPFARDGSPAPIFTKALKNINIRGARCGVRCEV
jgi:hypothetical protein